MIRVVDGPVAINPIRCLDSGVDVVLVRAENHASITNHVVAKFDEIIRTAAGESTSSARGATRSESTGLPLPPRYHFP